MKPAFCSSCIHVTPALRPYGADRGVTWLCSACHPDDATRPSPTKDHHRGYQVPERDYTATIREIVRAAPTGVKTRDRSVGVARTPGFVLVRVRRRKGDRSMDRDEARETLRGNSWFAELRHVSSDPHWHLFERPDVEAASHARRETDYDVTGELAAAARGGR